MLLSYILCLVRNKDQIPFHAVVLARRMLQPGGNIVPLFVYATEINGGKGEKVSQVSGFELGRFAQQALTCSWKCLLKNSWIRSQGAGGMKGMNATEGLSPLWVLLCLSQPSLPRSLHMCKKPTCSEQECQQRSRRLQKFEEKFAWPRSRHCVFPMQAQVSLTHLITPSSRHGSWYYYLCQEQKFGDCWDCGFSTSFKSGFDSKIWYVSCFSRPWKKRN